MCWAITIPGQSSGIWRRIVSIASVPPVEEPMAMTWGVRNLMAETASDAAGDEPDVGGKQMQPGPSPAGARESREKPVLSTGLPITSTAPARKASTAVWQPAPVTALMTTAGTQFLTLRLLQKGNTVHAGHSDIQREDIRFQSRDLRAGGITVRGTARYLDVAGIFERGGDELAGQRRVIHHQHPYLSRFWCVAAGSSTMLFMASSGKPPVEHTRDRAVCPSGSPCGRSTDTLRDSTVPSSGSRSPPG